MCECMNKNAYQINFSDLIGQAMFATIVHAYTHTHTFTIMFFGSHSLL